MGSLAGGAGTIQGSRRLGRESGGCPLPTGMERAMMAGKVRSSDRRP